jgi:CRISPR-associated endoribonuclease Cas6
MTNRKALRVAHGTSTRAFDAHASRLYNVLQHRALSTGEGHMATFELARYRFVIEPLETLMLPEYKGSTFRGGFGTVFRRVACACGKEATAHHRSCLYAQVFETPRDDTLPALPATVYIPHPFVLEPPRETQRLYAPGEHVILHLVLIGRAIDWLPYFVFTFEELGRLGLGQGRGRYRLTEVCGLHGTDMTPVFSGATRRFFDPGQRVTLEALWQPDLSGDTVDVELLTYTRIVGKGHLRESLDFPLLFGAILRRLALLMYAHSSGGTLPLPAGPSLDTVAFLHYFYDRYAQRPEARTAIRDAFALATQVRTVAQQLHWSDWERYSGRQDTHMKLGGVRGTVRYGGPVAHFLPYLRVGEYIHIGKNTAFGLGQIAIHGAPSLAEGDVA